MKLLMFWYEEASKYMRKCSICGEHSETAYCSEYHPKCGGRFY